MKECGSCTDHVGCASPCCYQKVHVCHAVFKPFVSPFEELPPREQHHDSSKNKKHVIVFQNIRNERPSKVSSHISKRYRDCQHKRDNQVCPLSLDFLLACPLLPVCIGFSQLLGGSISHALYNFYH